jgi:hypothetical protein
MDFRRAAHGLIVPFLLIVSLHAAAPCAADITAASITTEVANGLRSLFKTEAGPCVYAKAKTDGPDSDDVAVKKAEQCSTAQNPLKKLDADTGGAEAGNDVDDGTEKPYSPGDPQRARIVIHVEETDAGWKPAGRHPYDGIVFASPDDDPAKEKEVTFAAAAAMFSLDGTGIDLCYRGIMHRPGPPVDQVEIVQKVDCPKEKLAAAAPRLTLEQAGIFLMDVDRFTFVEAGGGKVRIEPPVPAFDLLHVYLQQAGNPAVLPLFRGQEAPVQDLLRDLYASRLQGTDWMLSEAPGLRAGLTIAGAALRLKPLTLPKLGRSRLQLLDAYFASTSAVQVVAPEHAQAGYLPQVVFRSPVREGQDLSGFLGFPFTVPSWDDGTQLAGIAVGVRGDLESAVLLAANTVGSFVRDIVLDAWDGTSATVEFELPGPYYHQEDDSALYDEAFASPAAGDDDPPVCELTYINDGPPASIEVTSQDLGSGLATIQVLKSENAQVKTPAFPAGTQDEVVVTAEKVDPKLRSVVQLKVIDVAGNSVTCDPTVAALHIARRGRPARQSFGHLPEAESRVTVRNGDPGIAYLEVVVNGVAFVVRRLAGGEERRLDVSSAMLPGNTNIITLKAFGEPGAGAVVVIHD